MRARAIRRVAAAVALATVVSPGVAAAKPAASAGSKGSSVLTAPYARSIDRSVCLEAESATCVVSGVATADDGAGAASARLEPRDLVSSGRAIGQSGILQSHMMKAAPAIRYSFVFEGVSARAAVTGPDLIARSMLGGHVTHSRCAECTTTSYVTIADGDPRPNLPAQVDARPYTVVVEVRGPDGVVPAGTLTAEGIFAADVTPYGGKSSQFVSQGEAAVNGRLSRIEVQVLPS